MKNFISEDELQEKVLHYSATIHQPHAIKTYLAAKQLYLHLQDDAIWGQALSLIQQSEVYNFHSFSNQNTLAQFPEQRIKSILNYGIYPVAYFAMVQWYKSKGFQPIFKHYLAQASLKNEALCHHITILLSLNLMHNILKDEQIYLFLDRCTEFFSATFHISQQVEQKHDLPSEALLNDEKLLVLCLQQPHFFGHNLITLAWLRRENHQFGLKALMQFKTQLYLQATAKLHDPEDEIDPKIFAQCKADASQFQRNLKELLFKNCVNLHQVTLADALLYLAKQFPQHTAELSRITRYFVEYLTQNAKS